MYVSEYKGTLPPNLFSYIPPGRTTQMGLGETWDVKLLPYMNVKLAGDPATGNLVAPTNFRSPVFECPSDNRRMLEGKGWFLRAYAGVRTRDGIAGYTAGPYGDGTYVGTMWAGGPSGPIKTTMVRKPSESVFLLENWAMQPDYSDANRQFRATFGVTDPPLGAGASPLKEALAGTHYHNRRVHFLFVDSHAGSENPNDFHKYKWFWRKYKG
jgi:prepilin-type processing-associated H-X9-DG protein